MVQFIKGSQDPREASYGMLAQSLGLGLGHAVNVHYANKALDEFLENPDLKDAPQSERMGMLQRAMQGHGPYGEKVLQNRLQTEQLANQEKQQKEQNVKGDILRRRLSGEQITEKEKQMFTPDEELAIAKHLQAGEIAKIKAGGKLTQASQPINPEQLNNIQAVRKMPGYEEASPGKKYQMLTDNNVSKENAEAEAKIAAEDLKAQPGGKYAEEREKAVSKLVTDSFDARNNAEDLGRTINIAREVLKGDITGPGAKALVKNNPYGQLMIGLTPDEAALQTLNKKMLEGTKGLFGPKPTEREIFLLLNSMLPSIGKSQEANLASLDLIEKANNLVKMKGDLIDEITDGGSKYVANLESQVNQRLKPALDQFSDEVRETAEKFGEEIKRLDVYDASGKKVGTVDSNQVGQLPKGHTAK